MARIVKMSVELWQDVWWELDLKANISLANEIDDLVNSDSMDSIGDEVEIEVCEEDFEILERIVESLDRLNEVATFTP